MVNVQMFSPYVWIFGKNTLPLHSENERIVLLNVLNLLLCSSSALRAALARVKQQW